MKLATLIQFSFLPQPNLCDQCFNYMSLVTCLFFRLILHISDCSDTRRWAVVGLFTVLLRGKKKIIHLLHHKKYLPYILHLYFFMHFSSHIATHHSFNLYPKSFYNVKKIKGSVDHEFYTHAIQLTC